MPFLTLNGKTVYCSGNLFRGYARMAAVPVRSLLARALARIGYSPLLKVSGAPAFLQAYVNRTAKETTVSLLAYLPEKRGSEMESVEDELTVDGFELSLKLEKTPVRIFSAPDGHSLQWHRNGEYITVAVPRFTGFSLIVVE